MAWLQIMYILGISIGYLVNVSNTFLEYLGWISDISQVYLGYIPHKSQVDYRYILGTLGTFCHKSSNQKISLTKVFRMLKKKLN